MTDNVPNAFLTEDNELVFVNVCEISPDWLGVIARADAICKQIEKKYGTSDINEMMRKGAKYKEIDKYVRNRHDLTIWGY